MKPTDLPGTVTARPRSRIHTSGRMRSKCTQSSFTIRSNGKTQHDRSSTEDYRNIQDSLGSGRMSMYNWAADKVPNAFPVGLMVFMELHWRIFGGRFGRVPEPLKVDAFDQRGYCIDAPDEMPAGACCWFQCDEEDGLPVQVTFERASIGDESETISCQATDLL